MKPEKVVAYKMIYSQSNYYYNLPELSERED